MARPKGWRKGYIKDSETGQYVPPIQIEKETTSKKDKPKVQPDPLRPVKDDDDYAKVIVAWKDAKGRQRTTQYTMSDLRLNEDINDEFTGSKKKTFIRMTLEGNVVEKI